MIQDTLLQEIPYSELQGAYNKLEKKNKDLIDSLYYAAFVQQGLMPQSRHFQKLEHEYFVYYNPLQIIGGDFFWIGKKDEWCLYAVGDCIGHGVSGAMLSALAIGFLNYVVYSKKFDKIGDILTEIDKKWIETFNHREDLDVNNDWLEMALIAYNKKTNELQFASASSSILLVGEDNKIERHRCNPFPIGGWQIEANRVFSTTLIEAAPRARLYLYTDGLKDQFGGPRNKRLGSEGLQRLIAKSAHLNASEQKIIVEKELSLWKHSNEQTDDVCLLRVDL